MEFTSLIIQIIAALLYLAQYFGLLGNGLLERKKAKLSDGIWIGVLGVIISACLSFLLGGLIGSLLGTLVMIIVLLALIIQHLCAH